METKSRVKPAENAAPAERGAAHTQVRDKQSLQTEDDRPGEEPGGAAMSLVGHLSELRKRIIICISVFVVALCFCLYNAEWFTNLLISRGSQFTFVYIAPAELLMSYIRVAFIGGFIFTFPVIVYHVWQFIRPGLLRKEKLGFGLLMTLGIGLFCVGVYFAFAVVLPILLAFFAGLDSSHTVTAMVSIQEYISYVVSTLVTFGIVFECPIVLISLVALDLVRPKTLQKNFKFVVLIVLVVGAIITPPDITSQILVAVPLLALFELSVLFSQVLFARRLKRLEAEERAAEH